MNYHLGLREECVRRLGQVSGMEVYEQLNRTLLGTLGLSWHRSISRDGMLNTYEVANSKIAIDAFEITLEHFTSFMSSTSFSVSSLRFLCGERERDKESERERARERERESFKLLLAAKKV